MVLLMAHGSTARLGVLAFEYEIEVSENCADDGLSPFSAAVAVDQDVVWPDICLIVWVSVEMISMQWLSR